LFKYDKNYISKRASEFEFVRDTLEFDDPEIIKRIENHPMALWKTM
jgi:hypothetical protein